MLKILFLVFFLAFFILSDGIQAALDFDRHCADAFAQMYPDLNQNERELLGSFLPENLDHSSIKFIDATEGWIFSVNDNRGVRYVIRINGYKQSTRMERFGVQFHQALGMPAADVRSLSRAEVKKMQGLVDVARNHGENSGRPYGKNASINVSLFHPGQSGTQFLIEKGVSGPIRDILTAFERNPRLDRAVRRQVLDLQEKAIPPDQLAADYRQLEEDLKDVPALYGESPADNPGKKIRDLIIYGDAAQWKGLAQRSLDRIPTDTLQRISDLWITSYVAGTADLNDGNFLVHNGTAFAIDVAYRDSILFKEGKIDDYALQFPLPDAILPPDRDRFFIQHASEELKAKLKSQTDEEVKAMAKQSGLTLTDVELKGIRDRRARVLQLALSHNITVPAP